MSEVSRYPKIRLSRRWQGYVTAYAMIFPALLLYVVFVLYPMFRGLWISFYRWDGLTDMVWIGTDNYGFVFKDE
jgi:ABC-type sugar transport system permease subunit